MSSTCYFFHNAKYFVTKFHFNVYIDKVDYAKIGIVMRIAHKLSTLLALLAIAASITNAQSIDSRSTLMKDGSVRLPSQTKSNFKNSSTESSTIGNPDLAAFNTKNGAWNITKDIYSQSAISAYGKPIRIEGYETINSENVRQAAEKFITENEKLLGVKFSELEFVSSAFYDNLWYVRFKQVIQGMEVLTSQVGLRISPNGKVGYATADFYNDIKLLSSSESSESIIAKSAVIGVTARKNVEEIQSTPKKYILPVKSANRIDFSVVKRFEFAGTGNQIFTSYVDVNSGNLLWRYNRIRDAKTTVTSKGTIRPHYANETPTEVNFKDFYFWANDEEHIADSDGKFELEISDPAAIRDSLSSRWAHVSYYDKDNIGYTGTATPGADLVINWDDNNSDLKLRTVFYHATFVHDFIKNIDPTFTGMDHQIQVTLYNDPYGYYTSPNASSDPSVGDISYWVVGDDSQNLSESPSVLYHEYGHSIAGRFYIQHGVPEGLNNSTVHETFADLNSAFILDSPYIGLGTETANPDAYIRLIDNVNTYPDSVEGESHHDSQILSGAYWDLRKYTNDLEYCQRIIHKVKFALIDDTDDGNAFYKFFRETLIADDDNNDLTDGTPHAAEIIRAFNNHKIGGLLALTKTFVHTPYPNTLDTINPYSIDFEVTSMGIPGTNPDSAYVTCSVNSNPASQIPAVQVSPGKFHAEIPAQKVGSQVRYYMNIRLEGSEAFGQFSKSTSEIAPYKFLVGYYPIVSETNNPLSQWTSGVTTDSASTGVWEYDIPEETVFSTWGYEFQLQPGTNSKGETAKCWVTGAKAYDDRYEVIEHCPDAITSVVSPVYNINGYKNPILNLYYWFVWMRIGGQSTGSIAFSIEASIDTGKTWSRVYKTSLDSLGWIEYSTSLSKYQNSGTGIVFKISVIPVGKYKSSTTNKYYPVYISKSLFDRFNIIGIPDGVTPVEVDRPNQDLSELTVFPNPVSDQCNISFRLNEPKRVIARVYSILGEEIATIRDQEFGNGYSMITWNGTTSSGKRANAGVYQLVITAGAKNYTSKIVIE